MISCERDDKTLCEASPYQDNPEVDTGIGGCPYISLTSNLRMAIYSIISEMVADIRLLPDMSVTDAAHLSQIVSERLVRDRSFVRQYFMDSKTFWPDVEGDGIFDYKVDHVLQCPQQFCPEHKAYYPNSNCNQCLSFVTFFDIVSFKALNDHLGQDVGDAFIAFITNYLNKGARENSLLVTRKGGDEFHSYHLNPARKCVTNDTPGTYGIERARSMPQINSFWSDKISYLQGAKQYNMSSVEYDKLADHAFCIPADADGAPVADFQEKLGVSLTIIRSKTGSYAPLVINGEESLPKRFENPNDTFFAFSMCGLSMNFGTAAIPKEAEQNADGMKKKRPPTERGNFSRDYFFYAYDATVNCWRYIKMMDYLILYVPKQTVREQLQEQFIKHFEYEQSTYRQLTERPKDEKADYSILNDFLFFGKEETPNREITLLFLTKTLHDNDYHFAALRCYGKRDGDFLKFYKNVKNWLSKRFMAVGPMDDSKLYRLNGADLFKDIEGGR